MKYYANYITSDFTTMSAPLCDTNKNRLLKDIRGIAKGHTTATNRVSFSLWDENQKFIYIAIFNKKQLLYFIFNGKQK